ncbi:MAG: HDOD domain-containing protein [Nitrospinaceae bacterium]|jgi:HD-like signal output (HDOD) protein|nr:HDOD domain-containing protein [Nitrospinaceae bacterium]MBT3432381.1 HDOD domain-containing protein [Nitrospinaceae bacterium]MBT3822970.1 HDOD domain-containing protein [Nitrospinaceae bacterium]MBT4095591.1 HDOD domain-containing protein [Nitrospinaceae bacterium]MBT4429519.1 HDOD domain-containing protein [Nitrospinaceae bacterium]
MCADINLLVKNRDDMPSLPTIFYQINETVNDQRSSMRDIAQIISADQSLSARLLRLVNSAFFGFPSKIDTISHAVTIIGTKQLRDLALATTVIQMFKGIPSDLIRVKPFWQHAIGVGIGSRLLASYHKMPNIEQFFVSGLLHDIGRLILYGHSPDEAKQALTLAQEQEELLHISERKVMGFDHADMGGLLLKEWRLSSSHEEAVRFHHRPSRSKRFPMECSITHIADLIANAMELGTSGERFVPSLDRQAWDEIALSTSILNPMTQQMDQQYRDIVDLFLEDIQ